ncbi:MAG: Holliday junction resolvase RuvX [Anaerolineales bacterium]|nr:Holliday junction resolvase RuvX [Anaerolineales bacterium]
MRILAIDPGEKRLGIAISDPTGTIANPLAVLKHVARSIDAATIAGLAQEHQAGLIVVGQALDEEGQLTLQARRAKRLAEAIRLQCDIPVVLWDESGSTQAARQARLLMGARRSKRQGHLDDLAATYILQTYLDTHHQVN